MTRERRTITRTLNIPDRLDPEATVQVFNDRVAALVDEMGLDSWRPVVGNPADAGGEDELLKILANSGVGDRAGLFESIWSWRTAAVNRAHETEQRTAFHAAAERRAHQHEGR